MPGTAAKVVFSELQMEILEEMVASRTVSVRLVQRARIVLLAYQKRNNEQIGEVVGLNPQQVGVWRKRWKTMQNHLIASECTETKAALRRAIEEVLADEPRKGRNSKFSTEQQAAIVAIACEAPDEKSQRPISGWTHREIADEAVKRRIVPSISASRVRTFLKSGRSQAASQQVLAVFEAHRQGVVEYSGDFGMRCLSRCNSLVSVQGSPYRVD